MHRKLKEQLEAISAEEAAQAELEELVSVELDPKINLFSYPPFDFAQQMTLLHKKIYQSIDVIKMLKVLFMELANQSDLSQKKCLPYRTTTSLPKILDPEGISQLLKISSSKKLPGQGWFYLTFSQKKLLSSITNSSR